MWSAIVIGIEEGCKYIPFMVSVCVVLRLARFPDFGIEGSFALGAASVAWACSLGAHPSVGLVIAMLCGAMAGGLTSFLFVVCRLNSLISGVITGMVAFTGCYCLLGWQAGVDVTVWISESSVGGLGALLALLLVLAFSTRSLLVVRFAGEQPALLNQLGVRASSRLSVLLVLGNGLTAVSGALVVSTQGNATLAFGNFVLFKAIVGLIMGEGLLTAILATSSWLRRRTGGRAALGKWTSMVSIYLSGAGCAYVLVSAVLGAFAYWIIYNVCTACFGAAEYTKLAVGLFTAVVLIASEKAGMRSRRLPSWSFIGRMP